MRTASCFFAAAVALSCTDAGLYATDGDGPSGPDRVEITGTACVPLATGENFPVKVLFAVQGGVGIDAQVKGQVVDAIQSVMDRFSSPYITFGFVAYHSVASGFQGKFVDATQMSTSIAKYSAYQEAGPISVRAPLKLASSLISGDMQTGCRGQIARARYLVILLIANPDDSCNNPIYNAGIDLACAAYGDAPRCTSCELGRVTEDLKALATKYNAGEVSVQPVYVRTSPDDLARFQGAAIARAGGTELIETDPGGVKGALNAINYASLQRSLKLKRLIGFNRNAISRDGVTYVDSDGDGISDEDEELQVGTDKLRPDTDNDGLMDGVELKMGLDPLTINIVNSCNPTSDTDGDRLNDCEERVLGTDSCITDSDGDGLPDLVEVLGGSNPLLPEDLNDDDRDGLTNISEIIAHSDPRSADLGYQVERGYGYSVKDADPTIDGRACYDLKAYNITLMPTLARPNPPYGTILKGTNDIYLYFQVGRDNDPRGTGIGSLFVERVQFLPPNRKKVGTTFLKGAIRVTPEQFVLGN